MQMYQNYINGKFVDSHSTEWIEVINPAVEEVFAKVPASSEKDVDDAVAALLKAFHLECLKLRRTR